MIKPLALSLTLTIANSAYPFSHPGAFKSSYIEVEEAISRHSLRSKAKGAKSALRADLLEIILNDKDNRIHEDFDIPEYFQSSTKFWFAIYSQYTSHQVVIHDKENLDLIYTVMDFEPLHDSNINRFAKAKLQADLALEQANSIKEILTRLHSNPDKLGTEEIAVLESIKRANIQIPQGLSAKKKLFKNLSNTIRTQTGQRDMVLSGVLRSLPFLPFIENQFENFDVPKELLAIAFVESSFNLKAVSYAGAAGIWQFMPVTASSFMPERTKRIDYRVNPIISSIAAIHLLKQNKMILKRWDLAIPAYNFGTSHLVRARRKFKEKTTLAYLLQNYAHDNLGFASKNYFSEVLAMARVLAYKEMIFPLAGYKKKGQKLDKDNLAIYVTKCKLQPKEFFSLLEKSSPSIEKLNAHFLHINPTYDKNMLVVSDLNLTSRKYRRVTTKELLDYYPKNLFKLTKNSKCGG